MRRTHLAALTFAAFLLSACAPGLRVSFDPRPLNLTVDNARCFTTATVFIDGVNVGTVPGGGVRSFPVSRGRHGVNVDNDFLRGEEVLNVNGDTTWRGGRCV